MKKQRSKNQSTGIFLALALFAGIYTRSIAAATTLADFEFNEGSGGITHSVTNDLTGTLGLAIQPSDISLTTDSPSGAAGDGAVQLAGNGFLLVNDTNSPVLAIQTNSMTLEAWVKYDSTLATQFEGIMAYGSSYKLGLITES
jgi:hypothetical protein